MDRSGRRSGSMPRWSRPSGCARRSAGSRSRSGYCTEQHNVRALGAHCPFSHQCLGCEHFRTDPSHLPDLYAYLERLLETRERLRAAVPAARGVGAREGDPGRRGDQDSPGADPRRRGRARRARARRASQAARAVPRAARDPGADGRHRSRSSRSPRPATPSRHSAAGVHSAAHPSAPPENEDAA